MSRCDTQEFIEKMPSGANILGLDIGSKTIGVAVCSSILKIATPINTIRRAKFKVDAQHIADLIKEYDVCGLVVGYPFEMSGEEGRRCQSVRDFMMELENHISCPDYTYQDERLSTASVDSLLDNSMGKSVDPFMKKRKAKEKGVTDKLAAQVILQEFIDEI